MDTVWSSEQAIGIFDSGVGGLSVVREIHKLLPGEKLIYFADSARAPWGVRPPEQICSFSHAISRFLLSLRVKLVVVACNTASVHALHALRQSFPEVPFVGLVPAVKPATEITRHKHIGVLATRATAKGQALTDLIAHFALPEHVEVDVVAPPGLVEAVERGELQSPQTLELLRHTLEPLMLRNVDTLVLGCSHYPFLREAIEQVTAGQMQLVDAGTAVARQCCRVLQERGLLAPSAPPVPLDQMQVFTSADSHVTAHIIRQLIGVEIDVKHYDPLSSEPFEPEQSPTVGFLPNARGAN